MISSRFTVAVHILALIEVNAGNVTSEFMAGSVNTNPAVIRRIMGMLSRAGLISSRPGVVGIKLLKPTDEITFLDVYRAVELPETKDLFAVHQNTNIRCPIGQHIQSAMEPVLHDAQYQMEQVLARATINQLVAEIADKGD